MDLKEIVLTATAFSIGTSLYSAWIHGRGARAQPWRWFYVLSRICYAIAFGLLLEALFKAPLIPADWRTVVFTVSVIGLAIGFIGAARHDHKQQNPTRGRYL